MLKEIEDIIKPDYGTKSEFIRDAIREKLMKQREKTLLKKISRLRGSSKRITSDTELRKVGEKAFEILEKRFSA